MKMPLTLLDDMTTLEQDRIRQRLISLLAGQRPLGDSGLCICLAIDTYQVIRGRISYSGPNSMSESDCRLYAAISNTLITFHDNNWLSGHYIDEPGVWSDKRKEVAQKLLNYVTELIES